MKKINYKNFLFFYLLAFGLFLNVNAQIDYIDYYDAGYSATSFKKKLKQEYKENERLFLEFEKDTAFIKTLDSVQILNVFYHLKSNGLYNDYSDYDKEFATKRKIKLICYSIACLHYQKAVSLSKYEMLNLLEASIESGILSSRSSGNKEVVTSLDNIIETGVYSIRYYSRDNMDYKERDRDLLFFKLLRDPKSLKDDELSQLRKTFLASKERVRAIHVLYEQTSRGGSKNDISFLLQEDLSTMSKTTITFLMSAYFNNRGQELISAMITNNDFMTKYCNMLLSKNDVEGAYNYVLQAKPTPEIKYIILECKRIKFGIIAAIDYMMEQKPKPTTIYNVLSEKCIGLSGKERLELTKHMINKYKSELDSVDITAIASITYWKWGAIGGGGKEIYTLKDKKDVFYFVKLFKDFGYDYESYFIEGMYWYNLNISVTEIQKYVASKEMKPEIAASILLYYGKYCTEDRAKGSTNREMLINECIPTLKKAAAYDPKNGEIYKALGDAYFFYGNGESQKYYNKAASMGVDMKDRTSAGKGGKTIKQGSRGGKYYINGNGNKTYVK